MAEIFRWAFFAVSICLSIYGANALLITLIFFYRRTTKKNPTSPSLPSDFDWPTVAVQLSVYDEAALIRRLIDSAANMDYPLDRLSIQVLDDSTDDTTVKAAERVEYWKARGRKIALIHRAVRTEYKAGALRNGMELDHSEFLALFDADFNPPADWLKRAIAPFYGTGGEKVGMVQTRWTHVNEGLSPLTHAEALMLDGTFGIEHPVRSGEGLFFNFNGTGGIWRRRCIEEAGGWNGETLSEDLDLSYRAQLKGWTFRYLVDVPAPAELPTTMSAYKIQQFRWAKGSMQVVRRQVPRIIRAPVSVWKKAHGLLHVSGFFVQLMMVLMVFLSLPLAFAGPNALKGLPTVWLAVGALGGPFLLAAGAWSLYPKQPWWIRVLWMPVSLMLGTGVAASNSIAAITGLLNIRSPFQRTPKPADPPADERAVHPARGWAWVGAMTLLEISLTVYALAAFVIHVQLGIWINAMYLIIYAVGFTWAAIATLVETFSPWLMKVFSPRKSPVRTA